MTDRFEIRLSGSGGQGIILASVILAQAFTRNPALHVCQTQSYGPEARGGKCKAEVVVSSTPIDYPKVMKLDLLLAMNQASCDSYFFDFKPNGLLIVDATFVHQLPTSRVIALPFTQLARDRFHRELVANMIALGAVSQFCPDLDRNALEQCITARAPKGTKTINSKAFRAGVQAAKKVDRSSLPRSIMPEGDGVEEL